MDDNTSLSTAEFAGTALRNTDLSSTSFYVTQAVSSFGDASVILPEGMEHPAHWPDWELPLIREHDFRTEWREWQKDPDNYHPPPKPK